MNRPAYRTAVLAIVGLAAVLRLGSLLFPYSHPDEVISLEVAQRIASTGSLDTNWKLASLPVQFKYPQYNFSAYLLSSAALLKWVNPWVASVVLTPLGFLRLWSALLGVLAVALTWRLGRQLYGARTGLIAAFLAALCPLLYQDSLYARPEPFVTVLTLTCVLVLGTERLPQARRIFLASLLLGVLIATKVSMLMLAPLLAIGLMPADPAPGTGPWSTLRVALRDALAGAIRMYPWIGGGVLLGFALGAPFALVNFDDYLSGLRYLSRQYGQTGTWPHGLPDGNFLDRLGYALRYFGATMGYPLLVLCALGAGLAMRAGKWRAALVFGTALLSAIHLSSYAAFFERNLSHLVPIFLICSAYAIDQSIDALPARFPVRSAAAGLLVALVAFPSARIDYVIRFVELPGVQDQRVLDLRKELESASGLPATQMNWLAYTRLRPPPSPCEPSLLEFASYGDPRSAELIDELRRNNGYRQAGAVASPFPPAPPSTLNTYFTPAVVFLLRDGPANVACVASNAPAGSSRATHP